MASRRVRVSTTTKIIAALAVVLILVVASRGTAALVFAGVVVALTLTGWGYHRLHGQAIDAANRPGRSVKIGNRTLRWWDTDVSMGEGERYTDSTGKLRRGHGRIAALAARLNPLYVRTQVGSLEASRRQIERIQLGKRVTPLDWSAPNRGVLGAGSVASGFTYDWCTCSEIVPLIPGRGGMIVNRGADTCLCLCTDCAPTRKGVEPLHWRARNAEHERRLDLRADRDDARADRGGWLHRRRTAYRQWREDIAGDAADRDDARRRGWIPPHQREGYDPEDMDRYRDRAHRDREPEQDPDDWYEDPDTDPGSTPRLDHE